MCLNPALITPSGQMPSTTSACSFDRRKNDKKLLLWEILIRLASSRIDDFRDGRRYSDTHPVRWMLQFLGPLNGCVACTSCR
jgi:hypothetical protein